MFTSLIASCICPGLKQARFPWSYIGYFSS
jgi:hypothetical protein